MSGLGQKTPLDAGDQAASRRAFDSSDADVNMRKDRMEYSRLKDWHPVDDWVAGIRKREKITVQYELLEFNAIDHIGCSIYIYMYY